jgi:hypothetical protein
VTIIKKEVRHQVIVGGIPRVLVTYSAIYDRLLMGYHGRELTAEASRRGKEQAAKIQEAWDTHSTEILQVMAWSSGLHWKRREIRAYAVSAVRYPISEPLTLWIGEKGENIEGQVTSLVHELAHTLLADNEEVLAGYWKAMEASYKAEDHTTIIHVPVQALLVVALQAVFGKDAEGYIRHERWWEHSKANPDMKGSYARSWNIVIKEGAASAVKRLAESRTG